VRERDDHDVHGGGIDRYGDGCGVECDHVWLRCAGEPHRVTDALGKVTTFAYDAMNRLTSIQRHKPECPGMKIYLSCLGFPA
jgi:YD repeat-containing protein